MPPRPEPEIPVHLFTGPLHDGGFRYLITGGVASVLYGEPRTTQDVDLILELPAERIGALAARFPAEDYYCPPEEVLFIEAARPAGGHFNLIHHTTGFKADVYVAANDPLHEWAMANRRPFSFEGEVLYLAPPEYVIVRKLEYFRLGGSQKHFRDIRAILAVESDRIDFEVLNRKIAEQGLQSVWSEISP